jgi:hypothetical protein
MHGALPTSYTPSGQLLKDAYYSPETHDVVRRPTDEENHEDDDRHLKGPGSGPRQKHQA